jgi:hypothetical protein
MLESQSALSKSQSLSLHLTQGVEKGTKAVCQVTTAALTTLSVLGGVYALWKMGTWVVTNRLAPTMIAPGVLGIGYSSYRTYKNWHTVEIKPKPKRIECESDSLARIQTLTERWNTDTVIEHPVFTIFPNKV